ncbi:MAG: HAD family phosphatase [Gemmatimonadetes bacterium]|uniref:HAD family phosphatase n=1 Tax=Candidatus Kutchimonas denitrificans TaxID=3056748 RepID=A0AAE4Z9K9_9BACT|nr:HAD family phosphatase [Gemmatimonadota bacterium]NIR74021.1 HAD family phosphatase [Candidatus Kutchimonas denitrificans]NIS03010.1 HAD family phosphatase [Gemmatimonadota bacterium]NIT68727.1 HAD family phosphatase [Gemmatimonadota bacterium]NIU53308.1 HAD-IA family hydrolase [Gemmatimonadota bacterium]
MSAAGVLFDLDGVLVATEKLKARAHAETVERLGGSLDPGYYSQVMGKSHYLAAKAFSEVGGIPFEHVRYAEIFRATYGRALEEGVELMPGARSLVRTLRARGYRLAVVSSSLRWMMDTVLARAGLAEHFDADISGDDVSAEKPAPDPYLKALAELDLAPERTAVVVEDTESGVASAAAAGVSAIAVRHEFNVLHDFSGAAAVVDGLEDVQAVVDLIEEIVEPG